jgi:DNA-binding CsgD family transcriptional regulator
MTNLISEAFTALKQSGLSEPEVWKPIYQAGLKDALTEGRLDEAAELALFAAVCLEAQGYYEDAIAELDFAISRTKSSPDVTLSLLGTLANLQAIRGDTLAFDTIGAAMPLRSLVTRAQSAIEFDIEAAIVACIFLQVGCTEQARTSADAAMAAGFGTFARGIDIWAVPAMVAHGQRRRAVPWVNSLGAHAEVDRSDYRLADFAALDFGLRSAAGMAVLDSAPFEKARRNSMAAWRAQTTVLYNAVLCRDGEAALAAVARLELLAPSLNPGHAEGLSAFQAVARLTGDETDEPEPPAEVTLVNLPAVMAAMEVVATRGSQEQAVAWSKWAAEHLPDHVFTSLEWPASLSRIHALLLVRMGKDRAGIALMERALQWCKSAGYPLEAALCEVQLSELLALGPTAAPERRWSSLRRTGRAALNAAAIDPLPHAFAATEALAWGRAAEAEPKLSPREVEVLGLLADGLTYRQIGERLGIEWRTVQVHARHIYEKLGTSGKMRAAKRAQELGII